MTQTQASGGGGEAVNLRPHERDYRCAAVATVGWMQGYYVHVHAFAQRHLHGPALRERARDKHGRAPQDKYCTRTRSENVQKAMDMKEQKREESQD